MNRKNMWRAVHYLEKLDPEKFNMEAYVTNDDVDGLNGDPAVSDLPALKDVPCGTVACIAGHIALKFRAEMPKGVEDIHTAAQEFLGLDRDWSHELFLGEFSDKNMGDITLSEATKAMRDMLAEDKDPFG